MSARVSSLSWATSRSSEVVSPREPLRCTVARSGSSRSRSQRRADVPRPIVLRASSVPAAKRGSSRPVPMTSLRDCKASSCAGSSATRPVSARRGATVRPMSETIAANTSDGVRWDLSPLFADDDAVRADLATALEDAAGFRERYRGRVADLSAGDLAVALDELSALDNRLSRIGSYAGLRLSVNVSGEDERDVNAAVDQGLVEAQNTLRFFELEWIAVDDDQARAPGRRSRGRPQPPLPDVAAPLRAAYPERGRGGHARRARAGDLGLGHALRPGHLVAARSRSRARTARSTSCSRSCATSGASGASRPTTRSSPRSSRTCRRRRTSTTASSRTAWHWIACAATRASATRATSPTSSRPRPSTPCSTRSSGTTRRPTAGGASRPGCWASTSSSLADQYAPHRREPRLLVRRGHGAGGGLVRALSRRASRRSRATSTRARIDAEPRQGKRGGAFCALGRAGRAPLHPAQLHREARRRAHARPRARPRHALRDRRRAPDGAHHHAPIALAEVPSTFAEMIVFNLLLAEEQDPATRLAILAQQIEGGFATVFRQTLMVRYEQAAYELRAEGKALNPDRLSQFWWDANTPYYGDAVELPQGYRTAGRTSRTSSTRASTRTPTCSRTSSASRSTPDTARRRRVRARLPRVPGHRQRRVADGAARGAGPRHHVAPGLGPGARRAGAPGLRGRGGARPVALTPRASQRPSRPAAPACPRRVVGGDTEARVQAGARASVRRPVAGTRCSPPRGSGLPTEAGGLEGGLRTACVAGKVPAPPGRTHRGKPSIRARPVHPYRSVRGYWPSYVSVGNGQAPVVPRAGMGASSIASGASWRPRFGPTTVAR